jgi:hypothetical protein
MSFLPCKSLFIECPKRAEGEAPTVVRFEYVLDANPNLLTIARDCKYLYLGRINQLTGRDCDLIRRK